MLGFNYTELDINRSRSFGVITREAAVVKAAAALFQADATRQPYTPTHDRLVVSPESTRKLLSKFIQSAKKELLIYDEKISDKAMLKLLRERAAAGVDVRVIGKTQQADRGHHDGGLQADAPARAGDGARPEGRVHRQPEPAPAPDRRPAGDRHHRAAGEDRQGDRGRSSTATGKMRQRSCRQR